MFVAEVQWTKPEDYVPEESADDTAATHDQSVSEHPSCTPQPGQRKEALPPLPTADIPLPPPTTTEISVPQSAPPSSQAEADRTDRKRAMPASKAYGSWEQIGEEQ